MNKSLILVSLASCLFGASQTMILGLIPFMSKALNLPLAIVVSIYGLSILIYLIFTLWWGKFIPEIGVKKSLLAGTGGLALSNGALLFSIYSTSAGGMLFIASRLIHAIGASSIIPLSQGLRAQIHGREAGGLLSHSLWLSVGRFSGLFLGLIFYTNITTLLLITILCSMILNLCICFWSVSVEQIKAQQPETSNAISLIYFQPLLFMSVIAYFNTSLSKTVSYFEKVVVLQTKALYLGLLVIAFFILLFQIILKKTTLYRVAIINFIAYLSLVGSAYFFHRIEDLNSLILFILLVSFAAALIPLDYSVKIFSQQRKGETLISGKISFYQTLGNALGAMLAGAALSFDRMSSNLILLFAFTVLCGHIYLTINKKKKVFV